MDIINKAPTFGSLFIYSIASLMLTHIISVSNTMMITLVAIPFPPAAPLYDSLCGDASEDDDHYCQGFVCGHLEGSSRSLVGSSQVSEFGARSAITE